MPREFGESVVDTRADDREYLPANLSTDDDQYQAWIDISADSEGVDLAYLTSHSSTALPPSPFSLRTITWPRAPTPSHSALPSLRDDMEPDHRFDSPTAQSFHSPLLRSTPECEASYTDSSPSRSFARPPKASLPDPSQFPVPYPFHPAHRNILSATPALSSAGSSSASTRSSAYTSNGSALISGDFGHVHVASGEEEVGVGITSDVVQLLTSASTSSSSSAVSSRIPVDQGRWSESYSNSTRSRSSSIGNAHTSSMHEAPALRHKPSYDMGWQVVDERDEAGLASEEESDNDHILSEDDSDEEEEEEKEEERTSAIVIAEEGRGLIVRGDGVPVVQLQVHQGTTHLLVGSSTTPNAMPAFLATTLSSICTTLLALDISANFLGALPPALAQCSNLEELNIASNPLRVLPDFLFHLSSLRVLIADATGISTLPESLSGLDKLHTLSIRRNKMHSIPSWLCLLLSLQTLYVDGNPFQGPWKALVEPLLAKYPATPIYPPSTPVFPLPSAALTNESFGSSTDAEDSELSASVTERLRLSNEDETITPERAQQLARSATSPPHPPDSSKVPVRGLTRTRTTPNRAYYNKSRSKNSPPRTLPRGAASATQSSYSRAGDSAYPSDREIRRMKSAGDLQGGPPPTSAQPSEANTSTPSRPGLVHYPTSVSSSNLLNTSPSAPESLVPKRFASLGVNSGSPLRSRPAVTRSLWDNVSESDDNVSPDANHISYTNDALSSPSFAREARRDRDSDERNSAIRNSHHSKDGRDRGSRWGFLKKMSLGKMKIDSIPPPLPSSRPPTAHGHVSPTHASATTSSNVSDGTRQRSMTSPRIEMRFSTTGEISMPHVHPLVAISPPPVECKPQVDTLKVLETLDTSNLLVPPSATLRSAKRRSFLPIESPLSLNIPIPSPSDFVPGLTATNAEDFEERKAKSPVDSEFFMRKEEERAREAYTRALRSVMAYLKDMNDLGSTQTNPMSIYGSPVDESPGSARSRRPTLAEQSRVASDGSIGSSSSSMSRSGSLGQLRSMESIAGLRSASSAQTLSVATTDSNGSNEERKYKDDKGKRAMIVREIVETERTYVKGLQELVDLYIKPGSAPTNMLGGVGSGKDTLVPASERRIVFNGIDALFSFHKENFLPALEMAAAPLMKPAAVLQEVDADGKLSLSVANAVASMFLKHAAFMRMYSSYINNFDSSVQRVKYWVSDRPATGNATPATLTPSSSTAQLVGLGLTMSAVSTPSMIVDGGPSATGAAPLTSSQRKRIRSYMKRCRMNPRHSQLNLEGYLLLPVQRIPRYRLLLEELSRSTPPTYDYMEDPLDRALAEISSLANNMNEGKRESESRRKLVQWQARIRGRFPSPLVQPHRRLIMDGPLLLTRVVRKAMVSFETFNAQGDASTVQVDCLAPELTPRQLIGILCNDLLVLCRDPSEGQDPTGAVDLWAVLRMQTLPQPASIVHGNALRLVDNKAILYFDAPSPSDALNWFRAINLHIPASKI